MKSKFCQLNYTQLGTNQGEKKTNGKKEKGRKNIEKKKEKEENKR